MSEKTKKQFRKGTLLEIVANNCSHGYKIGCVVKVILQSKLPRGGYEECTKNKFYWTAELVSGDLSNPTGISTDRDVMLEDVIKVKKS